MDVWHDDLVRPPWLVRFLVSGADGAPGRAVGAGFLVDDRHVVTCAHVVQAALGGGGAPSAPPAPGTGIWLDFPAVSDSAMMAEVIPQAWVPIDPQRGSGDFAVAVLPRLPEGARPAPLRLSERFLDRRFRTVGFPSGGRDGVMATGVLRGATGPGWDWIQMEDVKAQGYRVERGFSGAPVWDDALGGVIGMVVAEDANATLKVAAMQPLSVLTSYWEPLAQLMPSPLSLDPDRPHWEARARGVSRLTPATGWYFTDRKPVLRELVTWLAAEPVEDVRSILVTGGPGSGKSAVLARLVVTADPGFRRSPPEPLDPGLLPPVGSWDVVVHARRKTVGEVVTRIATATRTPVAASQAEAVDPVGERHAAEALITELLGRGVPLMILVDAVDEAASGGVRLMRDLLRPLGTDGSEVGIRLLIGGRRSLLPILPEDDFRVIDLDEPPYADAGALAEYAARRLVLAGEPAGTPYRGHEAIARRVADLVAARAGKSFLVAQMTCRALVRRPRMLDSLDPELGGRLPGKVSEAMDTYLNELGPDEPRAKDLLRALAYSEGEGLPAGRVWAAMATALSDAGVEYTERDLRWLVSSPVSDLVQSRRSADDDARSVFRLFHDALVEYLRPPDREQEAQSLLVDALLGLVPVRGAGRDWPQSDPYLLRHLSTHAAAGGRLDELIDDPGFLLAADPGRLVAGLPRTSTSQGRAIARLYRAVAPIFVGAARSLRASELELVARQAGMGDLADQVDALLPDRTWHTVWARWGQLTDHEVLMGHSGRVRGVAFGLLDNGSAVLVSGGGDGALRFWAATDNRLLREPLRGHDGPVTTLAFGALADGTPVVVSGGEDGTVRVWGVPAGTPCGGPLLGHAGSVLSVAFGVLANGSRVVVSGGEDGTARVWDLSTDPPRETSIEAHRRPVRAVALASLEATDVILTGSDDATIGLWAANTWQRFAQPLTGHLSWVTALATVELPDGPTVVVSGSDDATVRVWDLSDPQRRTAMVNDHSSGVDAVATVAVAQGQLLATGGADATVRVWPLTVADAPQLTGPADTEWVRGVALSRRSGGPHIVVSGGADGALRQWTVADGQPHRGPLLGHTGAVRALATTNLPDGTPVAISGSRDHTLRVWDLDSGAQRGEALAGHTNWVTAITVTAFRDQRRQVVSGGEDGAIWCWDLLTHERSGPLAGHQGWIRALTTTVLPDGSVVVVSAGQDGTIRLWDLESGQQRAAPLTGHDGMVNAVVAARLPDDGPGLVSGGVDGTLRLWSLHTGQPLGPPLQAHAAWLNALLVRCDGETVELLTGSDDATIRHWDVRARRLLSEPLDVRAKVLALDAHDDVLAVGTAHGLLAVRLHAGGAGSLSGRPVATGSVGGPS